MKKTSHKKGNYFETTKKTNKIKLYFQEIVTMLIKFI